MSHKWQLSGTYFETCNCDTTCPCIFLSDPTQGDCNVLVAWHIEEGNFNGVRLNDLNVAFAAHSPGNMATTPWKAAVYFDANASDAQKDALMQIFTGQAGGHPSRLVSHVGEVLGVSSRPMTYLAKGRERSLTVAGVAKAEIEALATGQGGDEITVENHPLCVAPGFKAVVGKSKQLRYHDYGMNWEFSDKNGLYSSFAYQSE
jgi:hypothetical protein